VTLEKMTDIGSNWRIRPATPNDGEAIIGLFERVFGERRTLNHWQWKYIDNPADKTCMIVAEDGGKIVGHHALVPFWMNLWGRRVLGAKSADRMVHPDYRRRGLSISLLEQLMAQAASEGIDLAYSVPNKKAFSSMMKFFGPFLGEWPAFIKILNPKAIIKRKTHSSAVATVTAKPVNVVLNLLASFRRPEDIRPVKIKEVDFFDERFDDLWLKVKDSLSVSVWRDSGYLNWRYTSCPDRKYTILTAETESGLIGYIVLRAGIKGWLSGRIIDFLFLPENAAEASVLVSAGLDHLRERGLETASCHITGHGPFLRLLKRQGFFKYGASLPIIAKVAEPRFNSSMMFDIKNWYLIEGDDIDQF